MPPPRAAAGRADDALGVVRVQPHTLPLRRREWAALHPHAVRHAHHPEVVDLPGSAHGRRRLRVEAGVQRRRLSQARDPRRVHGRERRCEINEVRQGRAHLVKVRVADTPVRLRLRRQHEIPRRINRQSREEVARVLEPQCGQGWIELGPAALPDDCVRHAFGSRVTEPRGLPCSWAICCSISGSTKPPTHGMRRPSRWLPRAVLSNISRFPYFQDIALPYAYSRMRLGLWDDFTWGLWEIGRLNKSWHPAPGTLAWSGAPEKLLILSEGGYGDVFLFTRLFRLLDPLQRAASRFVVGPQMKHLKGFARHWDGIPACYHDEIVDWSPFRFSTPLMSLLALLNSPADIPAAEPLKVDPVKSPARFGLAWQAEELGTPKRIRSIDREEELEPLSRFPFVSLLPGKTLPFAREADIGSWIKTARLMAGLDCVVAVDTAAAHLAALLNIPTLLILPLAVDWKYGTSGNTTHWWNSVQLIRNTSPYSFLPALEETAAILEKM